jgi:tetratricopeptide (TPR) repeat protein
MKTIRLLFTLVTLLLPAAAQDAASEEDNYLPWQKDFLNLPEDRRKEFGSHLGRARELFNQTRIFEAIEELRAAKEIFPDSPDVENLLGACQVEFRAFNKALGHFTRASELAPQSVSVMFNLGEVHFVSKNWEEAERYFERALAEVDPEGDQRDLYFLSEFKLMLCMIKGGEIEEARKFVDKYDFMVDTPFPYYAEAAIAYHDGREIDAERALARAVRVYRSREALSPWHDTLMEFGYIKSFYGGDLLEE